MKNSQKGFIIPLIVVIVTILAIGGGTYIYTNNKVVAPDDISEVVSDVPTSINPSIKVIIPNGGEIWEIGKTYTVNFTTTKELGMKNILLNKYSDDGVHVGSEIIGKTDKNNHSFTIPEGTETTRGEASRYKISVIVDKYSDGTSVEDESDGYFSIISASAKTSLPVACTMDAMQCPDGSYVGRTGPNCEFVCPNTQITTSDKTTVTIEGFYSRPNSLNNQETLVLKGLSEGEFVEIKVDGTIENFEHVSIFYDENSDTLIDAEILNKIDKLINKTIVIETTVLGGIPTEKVKWKSPSGKKYEFIFAESGIYGRIYIKKVLE